MGILLHNFNIENIILMFANLSQKRFYGTFQNMLHFKNYILRHLDQNVMELKN